MHEGLKRSFLQSSARKLWIMSKCLRYPRKRNTFHQRVALLEAWMGAWYNSCKQVDGYVCNRLAA